MGYLTRTHKKKKKKKWKRKKKQKNKMSLKKHDWKGKQPCALSCDQKDHTHPIEKERNKNWRDRGSSHSIALNLGD